jgi:hypothetical protein
MHVKILKMSIKSAIIIQKYARRFLCKRHYRNIKSLENFKVPIKNPISDDNDLISSFSVGKTWSSMFTPKKMRANTIELTIKRTISYTLNCNVLKQGWLQKKRSGLFWQTRWVLLSDEYLMYNKTQLNFNDEPSFIISIKDCCFSKLNGRPNVIKISSPQIDASKKNNSFLISRQKKNDVLYLYCENIVQSHEWLTTFEQTKKESCNQQESELK